MRDIESWSKDGLRLLPKESDITIGEFVRIYDIKRPSDMDFSNAIIKAFYFGAAVMADNIKTGRVKL